MEKHLPGSGISWPQLFFAAVCREWRGDGTRLSVFKFPETHPVARVNQLCVSTIEPRKRIDSLLAAYARLPREILATYPLVLAGGSGWQSESLHAAIDAARSAGWLRYLGFVDEADVPAIHAGAHLFVYPSIYEGFGLPVAEAMASGVPVVTSNRSALPEVAAGAARPADPDDLDALCVAIEASISDSVWPHHAIAKGLQIARQYNWDECLEQTLLIYNAAATQTNHR